MYKPLFFIVALVCTFLFSSINTACAQNNYLALHDEKFNFAPTKFYIADVADKRKSQTPVAILIGKDKNPPVNVDFEHGAVYAIKNFLNHNLRRDTTLSPVLLTINELKITETRSSQGEINGDLKIALAFSSQLSYQNKHLVDYIKEIRYKRAIKSPPGADLRIRQAITGSIAYFNTWMNKQKPSKPNIQAQ